MSRILFFIFLLFSHHGYSQKSYKIIAYYTGEGKAVTAWPVEKLTHIIYSFLKIHHDTLTFRNEKQRQTVEELVALKKTYPNLKIMVSVGGWGGCAPCSNLFADETHRKTFASTTVALFRQYGIDGLDLDWEYPAIEGYPGHPYMAADRPNFTALIKALRQEMGNEFLLTFAAGGFTQYLEESVDWNAVEPLVDFVNLMTYDLVGGYSKTTGHHTPLRSYRPGQESVTRCVEWLLQNHVPAEKLIAGAAMYARVWENVAVTGSPLYQPGSFKRGVAFVDFKNYFSDTSGFRYYWDRRAKAPYRYNANDHLFATFDDKRSIKEKVKFVRKNKLGGIMFWELSQDKKENGLVDVMYEKLKR